MILVTGSTGIVGTRLLFDLLANGKRVRALKRVGSDTDFVKSVFRFYDASNADASFGAIEWVESDLLDIDALDDAMEGITEVYHCAALVSYRSADAARLLQINAEGTANVVNLALDAGVGKLCHISSVAAIGKPLKGAANEDTPWKRSASRSTYGLSKYLAEQEVWRATAEGLPAIIVNPSVILGPAKPDQSSGMLMSLFRKGISFYPPGSAGFVDVRDVSGVCISLMESDFQNERYILNAATLPYKDMLAHAAAAFGNSPPRIALKPWMLEMAWPLASLWAALRGKPAGMTRETAQNASRQLTYDTSKLSRDLGTVFIDPRESLHYYKSFFD